MSPHTDIEPRLRAVGRALTCGVLWILPSCAVSPATVPAPTPRPLGAELTAYVAPEPSEHGGDDLPPPEPVGRLRLRDALAAAVLHHPALAAASWHVRAAEARALQAGLPSNPELAVESEEFGGDGERGGFGGAELTVGLSQEILLAGKLDKRRAVARLESELVGWDYEAARLDVLTDTAKAFTAVLAAQERLSLIGESVRLGEEVLRAVREQVRAGKVAPLDEKRAGVALALHRMQRDRVGRELAVARRSLAAHWGSAAPRFEAVDGSLYDVGPLPPPDAVANLLVQNPDIARWAVEMELHRANVALRRADRYPDVTLSVGMSHFKEDGGNAFLAGLAIPLPIFDQNSAGVLEALADQSRGRAEMRAAAIRVRAALFEAYEALAVSGQEAATLRDAVRPAAEEAFAAAEEGFRRGKFGYLDVLDAQRTLFEVREQLLDALAAHHAAVADVERLIGQSLDRIDSSPAPDDSGAGRLQGESL